MLLEHVHITIAPDQVDDYLTAFVRARPLVLGQSGCHSCRLQPKLDVRGDFLLLIEWESKEHHTEGFRKSPEYEVWSSWLHPFYDVFPTIEYFEMI